MIKNRLFSVISLAAFGLSYSMNADKLSELREKANNLTQQISKLEVELRSTNIEIKALEAKDPEILFKNLLERQTLLAGELKNSKGLYESLPSNTNEHVKLSNYKSMIMIELKMQHARLV